MTATATSLPNTTDWPLTDDEPWYEVINGVRVELPPMSAYATRVANRILTHLVTSPALRGQGEPAHEQLFVLPLNGGRNRRPDVAFISAERLARAAPMPVHGNAWEVVPDLAVEVVSPNDLAEPLIERIDDYFRAGVRLVWVVYPVVRVAYVYEAPTQIRVVTAADRLDGGAVLPGFQVALADLFPPRAEDAGPQPPP